MSSGKNSSSTSPSDMPTLTRSFLLSAIDHACSSFKTPFPVVRSKFDMWKNGKTEQHKAEQAADEQYIVKYANPRIEYTATYEEWRRSRDNIITQIKSTNIIGEQEKLVSELLRIPFPDILRKPVEDVYTKYEVPTRA